LTSISIGGGQTIVSRGAGGVGGDGISNAGTIESLVNSGAIAGGRGGKGGGPGAGGGAGISNSGTIGSLTTAV
jgi:hypothetical protein